MTQKAIAQLLGQAVRDSLRDPRSGLHEGTINHLADRFAGANGLNVADPGRFYDMIDAESSGICRQYTHD